ncbi:hypothetical protein cypCar_00000757 [Cyprinus carpio]|nr:hypothetical protein cypCar_00000757 [Cyprinus carpio]
MAGIWSEVWTLYLILALGTPDPSPAPQEKLHDFRRIFLGLDKCNACIGTSICKKFFKDEIRFERWLTGQSNLSSADVRSYEGNYTDSTAGWRPVVLSHLMSPHLQQISDNSICTSAGKGKSCSIEAVLRATSRFQRWVRSNLLFPRMVKGLLTPMLRCPSQRLLDRIVRRYFEVTDVGSVQMKHFSEKDKLRLLYTLAVNQQPLIMQDILLMKTCYQNTSMSSPVSVDLVKDCLHVKQFEPHRVLFYFANMSLTICSCLMMCSQVIFPKKQSVLSLSVQTNLSLTKE